MMGVWFLAESDRHFLPVSCTGVIRYNHCTDITQPDLGQRLAAIDGVGNLKRAGQFRIGAALIPKLT